MLYSVLCFLYVFHFELIKGIPLSRSGFVVGVFLFFFLLCDRRYQTVYLNIFKSRYHAFVLFMWSILFLFSVVMTVIPGVYDWEFCKVLAHQIVVVEIGFMLIALLRYKKRTEDIFDILIDIFIIQSLIIILSVISPAFRNLTNIFREDSVIDLAMSQYGGSRGQAIASSAFFGIAITYGVIFHVIFYHWRKWKYKNRFVRLLFLMMLFIGALSSGRTAIIGGMLVVLYACWGFFKRKISVSRGTVLTILFVIIIAILSASLMEYISIDIPALTALKRYGSEFIVNFIKTGKIKTTSTTNLLNMYIPLTASQILFGDGKYMDGAKYYMHTDVGYIRGLLYFGIIGVLLLMLYQWAILGTERTEKKKKVFKWQLFLMLLLFELKGEVIGVAIMMQALLVLVSAAIKADLD